MFHNHYTCDRGLPRWFQYIWDGCRDGPEWKKIRSAAAKQIMPRRVNNFITPLNEIADEFLQHVARIRNKEGYVEGIQTAVEKWAFQGKFDHFITIPKIAIE